MKPFFLFAVLLGVSVGGVAHAYQVEVGGSVPTVIGNTSQNFSGGFGIHTAFYVDPLLDPRVRNYVSVGFDSFGVKADSTTSFRVFPLLVGLELPGKVSESVRTTFGAAGGVSIGYLNVVNANSYRAYAYGTVQVRGGVEADLGGGFSVFARVPVTFLIASKTISYVNYLAGLGFKL